MNLAPNSKKESEYFLQRNAIYSLQVEVLKSDLGRALEEVDKLKLELKTSRIAHVEEFNTLKEKSDSYLSEVKKLKEEKPLFIKHIENLQVELKKTHTEAAAAAKASAEIEKYRELAKRLEEESGDLKEQVSSKNRKLQKLSQKKRLAVDEALALQDQVKALTEQLDSVRSLSKNEKTKVSLSKRLRMKSRLTADIESQVDLIKSSYLFDSAWYLQEYQDVAKLGMDPVLHFLLHGAKEGRDPSPFFNTEWYLKSYLDVAEAGVNPLVHYLEAGKKEGRALKV